MTVLVRIRSVPFIAATMLSLALSACGGGGGGSVSSSAGGSDASGTSPLPAWPSTGTYTVVLKASGSTESGGTALALSLVHSSTPQVEYVMDPTAAPSRLGSTLYQGTYSAAAGQFVGLSPVAYVDAPNGTLRTTLLSANGARPPQAVGPTQALCGGDVVASDVVHPFASVLLVGTPGADGTCGTADDGQVLISFSTTGAPSMTMVSGYLGFLRSSATGAPAWWLFTDPSGGETVTPFGSGGSALVVGVGTPGATVRYASVENLSDTILYSRNGALMGVGNGNGAIARQTLSVSTGPEGWKSAGNDATYAYAYLNSGSATSGTGTWQLLAVARSGLAATTLASGAGSVLAASAAPGAVYLSVLGATTGSSVTKAGAATGVQSGLWPSTKTITVVNANASGLNSVSTVSSDISTTALSLIDDQGNLIYSQDPGLLYGADSAAVDESSGDQVFAGVYLVSPSNATYLGGSALTRVDSATKTSQVLGSLPTGADLGGLATDRVFVTPIYADPGFGGFQASRLSGTQIVSAGSAVYTFDPKQANSVVRTTSQVR